MRVEQLMTKTVQSCRPHGSLGHAAHLMWSYHAEGTMGGGLNDSAPSR
jgi:hypothetical protein